MESHRRKILLLAAVFFFCASYSFALTDDDESEQDITFDVKLMEREGKLDDHITVKEVAVKRLEIILPAEKFFAKKINVVNITLLSRKEINGIILPYENKELSFPQIKEIIEKEAPQVAITIS